jgi:hypothetical protein
MATVLPWGKVTQSPDEMIFSGTFAPVLLLGVVCIAIAAGSYIVYSFYQSALLQTFSDSLRVSPSVLQIIFFSFLAFFLLLGILLICFDSKTTLIASKKRGQLVLRAERLFGWVKEEKISNINDVLRMELRKQTKMEKVPFGRGRPGQISAAGAILAQQLAKPEPVLYQESIIVFKDGRELLLGRMRTLSPEGNLGPVTLDTIGVPLVANQLASFLGAPFKETNDRDASNAS